MVDFKKIDINDLAHFVARLNAEAIIASLSIGTLATMLHDGVEGTADMSRDELTAELTIHSGELSWERLSEIFLRWRGD